MDNVFLSNITRNKTHQNDLTELCEVEPATPLINSTVNNLDCDFNPRYDKHYVPKRKSKVKVKTVRDIRNEFEKDVFVDLPYYLEKQQNILLRKIREGTSRSDQTKLIAKNILNSEEPISRSSWQMLMNINPEGHAHTAQYILHNGKPIRINGCRGGRHKFICNYNLSKVLKLKKNNSLSKSYNKKKNFLRNSVCVNFKPGPLSRKKQLDNSYQKYNVGDIELINLPKPGLEVQPSHGRTLDPMISNLVNNFRDLNGRISEKWAEFAVSVLECNNPVNCSNNPVTFDLNYKCNQRRLLMRRDRYSKSEMTTTRPNTNSLDVITTDNFDVMPEVRVIMSKILDAVDISLNQDTMYTNDEEPREGCEEKLLNVSVSNTTPKDKNKKKYGELDRLDVTVIRLPENEKKDLSMCKNEFCTLGCVCDSLQSVVSLKSHCGRIDCMFECKCDLSKYNLISEFEGECSDLLPGLINLEKEINHKLSKEEQKFHQTVILTGNQSIVLKSKKRNWKSSKKYADFYSKMCLKTDAKLSPILSVLINKFDSENIEPWCMVHNLYKCFCKGKFTESIKTEKLSNDSEKGKTILDKELPNNEICISDDGTQDKLKPHLRQGKVAERNSLVIDLDKEPDTKSYESNDNLRYNTRLRLDKSVTINAETYQCYNSCARTKAYEGRKYSHGYYFNLNNNIKNLEVNDDQLRKRLQQLVGLSEQDQNDELEKNVTPSKTSRSERLQKRRARENASEIGNAKDKIETNSTPEVESNLTEAVESDPMAVSSAQTSVSSNNEPPQIKMTEISSDKRITNKPQLVAWLESSYQHYKKRAEMGVVKNTLEPPKNGKVLLYPWDFILNRYSGRKNLFLISKTQPYRIFMAVDNKHPLFQNCINIDEIRFADLHKYPITVKNLLTNTSGLKDNFCILFGLPYCWELIGSVMKINDPNDDSNNIITNTLSDQAIKDITCPTEENLDYSPLEQSVPQTPNASESLTPPVQLQTPNKNNVTETLQSTSTNAVSESSKWFVMTVENDFSEIQFYNKGFFVKHESIMKALSVARASGKTVRLSSQKCADKISSPQFGIYAIPNASEDCVFVGPYEIDENLGIETVKLVLQVTKLKEKTRGVWITTNKIDNLKVIDNPLSFMPSPNVQRKEMLPLDKVGTESNNVICIPVSEKAIRKSTEMPVVVTSEKPIKTPVKPITIRKSGICRIASSKSLLKTSTQNVCREEDMVVNSLSSQLISIPSEIQTKITLDSNIPVLILDADKSLQNSNILLEQKMKKPVAEVAPQIKIAAVYSEAEVNPTEKRPERTMLILKPEEINKRHLENIVSKQDGLPSTSCVPENDETMDIEHYLESSNICPAPKVPLIISDDEEEPLKNIWLKSTTINNLGLIPARMNNEGEISFQFPGFRASEFYPRETAFVKINQVLSRKVYVPNHLTLEWDIIESKKDIRGQKLMKIEDFKESELVLTKHGLLHKSSLMVKTAHDPKTYGRKKSSPQVSPSSNRNVEEATESGGSDTNIPFIPGSILNFMFGASEEDRQRFANTLENFMQENQETSLPSSELFEE